MHAPVAAAIDGLTQRLAEFTASFSLSQAPAEVLQNAKLAILDCLGVSVVATRQEIGAALKDFARRHAGKGPCTVWGTGISVNARDAALINGALAHGLDFDDRNHSSTYSLAAPLAASEENDLSGDKLLAGFIVGREIRNSLDAIFAHRGSGIGPGAKGWHSNGVLGPIASACAVAKALDTDTRTTLMAIGLATASSGALTRDGGTMAKPFRTGHAAATGLTCVLLAKSGFTADNTALERLSKAVMDFSKPSAPCPRISSPHSDGTWARLSISRSRSGSSNMLPARLHMAGWRPCCVSSAAIVSDRPRWNPLNATSSPIRSFVSGRCAGWKGASACPSAWPWR
jgi:2-methylcitrate dehydratase PrpD